MKSDQILPHHIYETFTNIITFFQKYKIPYVLCGAMVLPFYGRPRTTLDLDFLILIPPEQFEQIKKKIENKMIHIISPEDFIIQKIKVGRPRDFEDAAMVLQRMKRELSMAYIQRWIHRIKKTEEWFYLKKFVADST
jgi:hypothetical protein